MHLCHVTATLDLSGTPTAVQALDTAMRAHDPSLRVSFLTKENGEIGARLGAVTSPSGIIGTPDVLLIHHSTVAKWAINAWPLARRVFYHHGHPLTPDHCPRHWTWDAILSINHQCTEQMRRERITGSIEMLRDAVDRSIYTCVTPPQPRSATHAPRVLFVSNYKRWRNYQRLEAACKKMSWPLTAVGSHYGRARDAVAMASRMNEADLIVSWGRGILEGAACGRPVISYDQELGDGYLTIPRFLDSRERNFSGYECRYPMGMPELCEALEQYDPADGARLASLIAQEHDIHSAAVRCLDILTRVLTSTTA